MDDLDFNSGKVTSHYKPVGSASAARRVLAALALLGLAVAVIAVMVEHQFWWLTLTGRRATARIVEREEHVLGHIYRRGMSAPLIETEFHFTFADDAGTPQRGSFWLIGASDAFRAGQEIPVIYPRFGSGPSQPASWSFYMNHDPVWFAFTSVGLVCLVLAIVCLWWRARTARPS